MTTIEITSATKEKGNVKICYKATLAKGVELYQWPTLEGFIDNKWKPATPPYTFGKLEGCYTDSAKRPGETRYRIKLTENGTAPLEERIIYSEEITL